MGYFGNFYSLLSFCNLLLAIAVVFMERRNVGVTWAWLMVLLFLPGIGFILYLILGQNLSRRKIYKIKEEYQDRLNAIIEEQRQKFVKSGIAFHDAAMLDYQDMIYMNLTSDNAIFSQNNKVEFFTNGNAKFKALLRDIQEAQHHIHLMYYIVKNDKLGKRLIEKLAEKAREGVEVLFLYDDIGSTGLPKRFFKELIDAGGHATAFFPSKIPYLNFRVNYRNHRKLAIIDGTYGYIGGFNVGDEYLGLDPRFGEWRDTHLRVEGSAVLQMQAQFILDWNLASEYQVQGQSKYFPSQINPGNVGIQIVTSGPDNELEQIRNAYIKMIYAAKQSIYIQTPYFIPDESLLTALRMAALSGVDVRIMIPHKPDHKMVYWASFSYLRDLFEVGVRCYLYEKGFLHAKTIVIDGKVASIGTANIDIRSFKLNFEVNAILYDTGSASTQKMIFEQDMTFSRELTYSEYRQRSLFSRFKESFARLLSPIL